MIGSSSGLSSRADPANAVTFQAHFAMQNQHFKASKLSVVRDIHLREHSSFLQSGVAFINIS